MDKCCRIKQRRFYKFKESGRNRKVKFNIKDDGRIIQEIMRNVNAGLPKVVMRKENQNRYSSNENRLDNSELSGSNYVPSTEEIRAVSTDFNGNMSNESFKNTELSVLNNEHGHLSCLKVNKERISQVSTSPMEKTFDEDEDTCKDTDNDNENDRTYNPSSESEYSDWEYYSDKEDVPDTSFNKTLDLSNATNAPGCSAIDDTNLTVPYSNKHVTYDKVNFCTYCKSLKKKIVRHYLTVHKNEEDVMKFSVLPKKCAERREIIKSIRLRGNFEYNTKEQFNKGDLIVARRPNNKFEKTGRDYICCPECKMFISKNTYHMHTKKCLNVDSRTNRTVKVLGRTILGRIHKSASEVLKKVVFPVLREDKIVRSIRYDELLIIYGNKLCLKYKQQQEHNMIRNRLRTLGRFLEALKEINPTVTDFASVYNPSIYDDCIKAVYKLANYDEETKMFKSPYTAFQLGTLLKQVGEVLRSECIKKQDSAKKTLVEDFLILRNEDYGSSVNKTVEETQSYQKRHKIQKLPKMDDIKKYNKFLSTKRDEAYAKLQDSFCETEWLVLAETTLLSLQVFNRKRAGEIERATLDDFKSRHGADESIIPKHHLSSHESNELAHKYVRFEIRGKKNRTVPVLLYPELEKAIELIIQYRNEAKIHPKNPYVFALKGFHKNRYKYMRACELMRKYSKESGVDSPHLLRGTILRKHIATRCMQYNMDENTLSKLTNFMGHKNSIHKEYYRLPQKETDILEVSRYLEAAQGRDNTDDMTDFNIESTDDDSTNDIPIKITKRQRSQQLKKGDVKHKVKRVKWTREEKSCVLNAFSNFLTSNRCPPTDKIETLIKENKCLRSRSAQQVKTWFNNQQRNLRNNGTNQIKI